jgi:16S rRNA (adenine1518-N6/adenine1519-N6)-dimethyltransferase
MAQPVRAKKHLGQHFLCDENFAKKIVDALIVKDKLTPAIEIGPGTGVLTKYLVEEIENFHALDVDGESIDFLKNKFPQHTKKFMLADFLEADLNALCGDKFNVIGNFPYNISTQIMFRVLEHRNNVNIVVGMFQKEVAQRIAEKPGTKTYGILSVLLQAFYNIEYLFTVHQNVFSPPPKVKSAVIRLERNNVKQLDCDESLFFKVVKTTFNQRRKTIRNSIKPLGALKDTTHPLFDKRPEQLSVAQFVELTLLIGNDGN